MTRAESRRLTRRFLMLLILLLGLGIAGSSGNVRPKPKSECHICPELYHCNWVTGDCECDCPDFFGNCPTSCA